MKIYSLSVILKKFLSGMLIATFLATVLVAVTIIPRHALHAQLSGAKDASMVSTDAAEIFPLEGLESPVFQNEQPIPLSQAELVTFMKQIPSLHPFKRVRLERDDLFIDFQVRSKKIMDEHIFVDAYQVINNIYMQTSNVRQVYMRFIHEDEKQQALVVAITSRKEDIQRDQLFEELPLGEQRLFILENTRVIYGTGWRR